MDDSTNMFYSKDVQIYSITFAVLLSILYWIFYVPCNWVKRPEDFGYNAVKKFNLPSKRCVINQMHKFRQIDSENMPPPYPNGWFSIMESSDLKVGEIKCIFALGQNFVVYRTLEHKVYAINAYCPHMGANLGIGSTIHGDSIECPFHQWRFRGSDGKCVNIPYSSCAPPGSHVKTWITQEVNDNIFLWYHAELTQEPWPLPVVTSIENKQFAFHGRNEFYINCHIQEIPENGADLAHFTVVHKSNFLVGKVELLKNILRKIGNHNWETEWVPSKPPNKHLANIKLKHSIELIPNMFILPMQVYGQQIGPSYVQLHMVLPNIGVIEVLQTVTPIGPLLQKVVHRFYAHRILAPIMKVIILGESIMFERDVLIWNNKVYRKRPQLPKEDVAIKLFRNWYLQFYSENSQPFKRNDTYQW